MALSNLSILKKNLFKTEVQLIYNAVLVSGA